MSFDHNAWLNEIKYRIIGAITERSDPQMEYYLPESMIEYIELDKNKDYTKAIAEILNHDRKITFLSHSFDKPLHIRNYAECFDITETYDNKEDKYPLIQLDFKQIIGDTVQDFAFHLFDSILKPYLQYVRILNDDKLPEQLRDQTKQIFLSIMKKTYEPVTYEALGNLCDVLHSFYDKEVLIFIENFDAPFMHAKENAGSEDMTEILKHFISKTLHHSASMKHIVLTVTK